MKVLVDKVLRVLITLATILITNYWFKLSDFISFEKISTESIIYSIDLCFNTVLFLIVYEIIFYLFDKGSSIIAEMQSGLGYRELIFRTSDIEVNKLERVTLKLSVSNFKAYGPNPVLILRYPKDFTVKIDDSNPTINDCINSNLLKKEHGIQLAKLFDSSNSEVQENSIDFVVACTNPSKFNKKIILELNNVNFFSNIRMNKKISSFKVENT